MTCLVGLQQDLDLLASELFVYVCHEDPFLAPHDTHQRFTFELAFSSLFNCYRFTFQFALTRIFEISDNPI